MRFWVRRSNLWEHSQRLDFNLCLTRLLCCAHRALVHFECHVPLATTTIGTSGAFVSGELDRCSSAAEAQ
jgi:hypothetical protein